MAKRGSKKVRPIYEDNKDCVLLYACGWSEYTSLPSNSHIKYNCPGRRVYKMCLVSPRRREYTSCSGRIGYTGCVGLEYNTGCFYRREVNSCLGRKEYISCPVKIGFNSCSGKKACTIPR